MKRQPLSICIAIPIDDGARPEFWISLINFIVTADQVVSERVSIEMKTGIGDSLITRARNNLVHDFLTQTKADFLMFLDTDLDFNPEDIARLIRHRRDDAILCGQYAIKQPGLRYCYNPIKGEKPGKDGLLKVGLQSKSLSKSLPPLSPFSCFPVKSARIEESKICPSNA